MAKTQKAQVVITANAATAKKIIDEVNQRIADLKQKMAALDVSTKQGQRDFNKYQKELVSLNSAQVQNITNTERISKAMNNLSKTSLTDLKRALSAAKSELNKMSAEDPNLKKMQGNIKALQGQIDKLQGSTKNAGNAFTNLVKHGAQMVAMYASLNSIKSAIESITGGLFKMSDELTDIRKVSGLTMNEVNMVSDAIRGIDTRTSVSELNKLAYAGSKLGMASGHDVESLVGFTKAADQLGTALHEDLGDDAITAVSKMTQVMGDMDRMGTEKALLSTGSAIFTLASTSTANGKNIVEFSKRLVGLAKASKMTTPEILALGSAADSMMLMPEVASTAMSKFITALQTNWNLIEKDLKMKAGSLQKIIEEQGVMPAMQEVLKQMNETGNMNALNFMFDDLGSEGTRLKNVLVTMAQNYDMLQDHLDKANDSFADGIAVTREYRMQQETAAAYMERAGNVWQKAFVNRENVDLAKEFAQAWYDFSVRIASSEGFITSVRLALEGVFAAITLIISILPNLLIGLGVAGLYGAIEGVIMIGSRLITFFKALRISIEAAKFEWAALNMTMKMSIIGAVVSAISILVMVLKDAFTATEQETKALDDMRFSQSEITRETSHAEAELKAYADAIRRATNNGKERQAAIKQFNDKFGSYLHNLGLEVDSVETLESAYNKLRDAIIGAQLAKLKNKYIEKFVTPRLEWELNKLDVYGQYAEKGDKRVSRGIVQGIAADSKSAEEASYTLANRLGVSPELVKVMIANSNKKISSEISIPGKKGKRQNAYGGTEEFQSYTLKKLSAKEQQAWAGISYIYQNFSGRHFADKVDNMFEPVDDQILAYYNSTTTSNGVDASTPARDKEAEKAARKAAQEKKAQERLARIAQAKEDEARKKAERDELEAAENEAKALIDNIESYYDIQEAALDRMVVNGEITAARAKQVNSELEQRKNKMLANAKLALSGQKNRFEELADEMGIGIDQLDFSSVSEGILVGLKASNPLNQYNVFKKYSGKNAPDDINGGENDISKYKSQAAEAAKAFQDLRKKLILTQQEAVRSVDEIEKLQYEYADTFINMGFARGADSDVFDRAQNEHEGSGKKAKPTGSETVEDNVKQIDEVISLGKKGKAQDPFSAMLEAFRSQVLSAYDVDVNDADSVRNWLEEFVGDMSGSKSWAKEFPQLNEWLQEGFAAKLRDVTSDIGISGIRSNVQLGQDKIKYYQEAVEKYPDDSDYPKLLEKWTQYTTENQTALDTALANQLTAFEDFKAQYADIFSALNLEDVSFDEFKQNSEDVLTYVSSLYKDEMRSFFLSLMKYSDDYEDAEKKRADRLNKMAEYKWKRSDTKRSGDDAVSSQESVQKNVQMRESFGAMSSISAMDPEILLWQKRIDLIKEHIAFLKENGATSEKIHEEELKLVEANDSLNKAYVNKAKAQADAIRKWMAPIEEYGTALGEAVFDESKTVKAATEDMIKSFIKLTGEYVNQKITQWIMTKLYNSMMATSDAELVAEKQASAVANATTAVTEAGVETTAGIAAGSAKTIGELGWWGIPLIAAITAVLNGLMSLASGALSKAFGSSSSSNKVNTKLVTGMLTYDSGNVQTYAGADGGYYSATSVSSLSTGLVTSPIATTVNGQPSLVGEKGPEIVVGRETTAAIMRNDPALLRYLINYDSQYSGRRRTYDEGNISDSLSLGESGGGAANSDMSTLMSAILYRLENPIAPNINMYGRDGLQAKLSQANTFMRGR